jgi:3-methyladenine DNA glycosylase AlkD
MKDLVEKIRAEMNRIANPAIAESSKRFFKEGEGAEMYGIKSKELIQLSKAFYKEISKEPKAAVFGYCEEFWQSGIMEETFFASDWAYNQRKSFEPADFKLFEKWVNNYVSNWATCDTLCNHTIGSFIEMYPLFLSELKGWAVSENRWMKRAAAVSLIVPARKGLFLDHIFEITTLLLNDGDDMVQKGYGWLLKVASNKHCEEVFNFVAINKATMPRTALRYAIEKMPDELKREAMKR